MKLLLQTLTLVLAIGFLTNCHPRGNEPAINLQAAITTPSTDYTCNALPVTFSDYQEALQKVKAATFPLKESVNTTSSSWITGASYYSCDRQKGFLILTTDSKEYIHQDVPIALWRGFKEAGSFGSYYSQTIKGRYPLRVSM